MQLAVHPHTTSDAREVRLHNPGSRHRRLFIAIRTILCFASRLSRPLYSSRAVCRSQILLTHSVPHQQMDQEQLAAQTVILSVK